MDSKEKLIDIVQAAIDEDADDAYCEMLYKQYESDPDKGETIGIEEVARQLGITLQ